MASSTSDPAVNGIYTASLLQAIRYGPGSVSYLCELVKKVATDPSKPPKVLIITGKSLATKTPVVARVEELLKKDGMYGETFYGIGERAPIKGIRDAIEIIKEKSITVLVGLGGGSPIDASKAIAYYVQQETGSAFIPQVAIPTTLSAAEFTINAGHTTEDGKKIAVAHPELGPKAIILDAELTLHTPEKLWLSTGMRAVDHAVETQYRAGTPLPVKRIALLSLHSFFTWLPKCKADPKDLVARQKLQIAAWESLWPNLQVGPVGLSHALGHVLGATYDIPHGITSCLTLDRSVALLATTLPPYEKSCLAQAVDFIPPHFKPSSSTSQAPVLTVTSADHYKELTEKCLIVAEAIKQLVSELGLATTLGAYNVPQSDFGKLADGITGGALKSSPGTPTSQRVVEEVLMKIA